MALLMIDWMVQQWVVVAIIADIVVGISVWNAFVLRHVQPRHFLSVKNLKVLKAL